MNITEIQVDRCGAWRNLTLPVRPHAVNVFFGPNEAGKTTLRQFIRGVLFGFSQSHADLIPLGDNRAQASGSLNIEDADGNHRIHRALGGELAGDARLILGDVAAPAQHESASNETHAQLFDRIFAVNLRELSEISSLSGDDVSQFVFGLSLGPLGEQFLCASRKIDERRTSLFDPQNHKGELVGLFEQHDQLRQNLSDLDSLRDRHTEWSLRRDQLEHEIASLRQRQTGTAAQLRGHVFIERAWGPWSRARQCRNELDLLPAVQGFPDRGVERLDRTEGDLATAAEHRDRLLAEVRNIRQELQNPGGNDGWRQHAGALRGFVEQRGWLAALEERREAARQHSAVVEQDLHEACERLGPNWTAARLEDAHVSSATERRLMGTAESFRAALVRRKMVERKCRRLRAACRELKDALAETLHDLEGSSIAAALAQARERIPGLNQLTALKLRAQDLSHQMASLEHERNRTAPQLNLPPWVHVVLGVFAFMGVILAGWGFIAGVSTSGITGTIYAMLGITSGGLAWGFKTQYERDARQRLLDVDREAAALAEQLAAMQTEIQEADGGQTIEQTAEEIVETQQDIADLAELETQQQKLKGLRRRLSQMKKKLHQANLEVGTVRHNWQELLQKIGLPHDMPIADAPEHWQLLVDAAAKAEDWKHAGRELSLVDGIRDAYLRQINELSRRLPGSPARSDSGHSENRAPLDILADWEEQLALLDQSRAVRGELKTQLKHKQNEAAEARSRVAEIKVKRNALLVQGGAGSRDEFEERAREFARRIHLRDQLQEADHDLAAVCATHTDLALVEEDLQHFNVEQNRECIATLQQEQADLERDLERAFEHLGGVKRELEALENDSRGTHLRFQLRQLEEQLQARAREWLVCETAAQTLDDLRRHFEQSHQPLALAQASRIFSRLTCGNYTRVWSPLGERRLVVTDDAGTTVPVQLLSRGTREQLLLAVRLAVVHELAQQGLSFPVILDDVFVNFDGERSQAAVDLLLELGTAGQQILFFTCHHHLVQLFASRGVEATILPSHAATPIGHDEARLAG
jgi:uncharacterized protein YhaN